MLALLIVTALSALYFARAFEVAPRVQRVVVTKRVTRS